MAAWRTVAVGLASVARSQPASTPANPAVTTSWTMRLRLMLV
jgi:hypothetical protein